MAATFARAPRDRLHVVSALRRHHIGTLLTRGSAAVIPSNFSWTSVATSWLHLQAPTAFFGRRRRISSKVRRRAIACHERSPDSAVNSLSFDSGRLDHGECADDRWKVSSTLSWSRGAR